MSDYEVINHRLDTAEDDIKILYKKVNDVTLSQVSSDTKLDSVLITLGEMKESIETLKKRPGWLWDRVVIALVGAICGVLVNTFIS